MKTALTAVSHDDAELDRQLALRHDFGEEIAQRVRALFDQLWSGQEPKVMLDHELLERSLHSSEVSFAVRSLDNEQDFEIFPTISITSEPALSAEMRLLYTTPDGLAETQTHGTLEGLVAGLAYQLRNMAGGAPLLPHERRFSPREAVDIPTIVSFEGTTHLQATMVNRSRDGAMVQMMVLVELPSTVTLLLYEKEQACTVVWQDGPFAGLRFKS